MIPTGQQRHVATCAMAVCGALLVIFCGGTLGADGGRKSSEGITYVSLGDAVASARRDYRPFLVYFDGGGSYERKPDDVPTRWEEATSGTGFRRFAKSVAICRLGDEELRVVYPPESTEKEEVKPKKEGRDGRKHEPAKRKRRNQRAADPKKPPESAAKRLGLVDGVPAVLVVDFRERVVRRFMTEFPKKRRFHRALRRFIKRDAVLAKYAIRAEKVLERSNYSYELGKRRNAVQQVLPFEDPLEKKKMDPVLKGKVEKVVARYRGDAQKLVEEGFTLDRKKKYAAALKVLENVTREFPFPDLLKKVHVKRAEILRKAQLGI